MTLKEKFEIEIKNKGNSEILLKYKCAKIADDYAIEFAEWCFDVVTNGKHFDTIKELLEIFKKEKYYE